MVFPSQFVYMVDYLDGFLYVEPSLHLWDETYLVTVEDFSDVFLVLVCQYFIEYFCINVHEEDWSVILFPNCIFLWFGYLSNCSLIKRVGNVLSAYTVWNNLRSIGITYSLITW